MNILWITLESILPSNTGGRIGVFKRLEQLSKTDNIFLFYTYDDEIELSYKNELKKYCKQVFAYSRKRNKLKAFLNIWKYPFTVSSRAIPELQLDVLKCIKEKHIDLINVDFPQMCVNLVGLDISIPIVLNEHNVEWLVYRDISRSQKNLFKKLAYYFDSIRLKYYEKNLFKNINFSCVTFVSSQDMHFMVQQKIVNESNAKLIPVGADEHKFVYAQHSGKNIIFVGKMSYAPNIEAVRWFVDEIFPLIKKSVPELKFYIVGKSPSDEIRRLQSKDIIVTGLVDDISFYYGIADLVVLPLKHGGGVKVKLLEAISYKKPVVSTSVGAEGTYFENHLIPISDNANFFAKYCIDVLYDKNKYPLNNVTNYFLKNYTWKHIGNKYRHIMNCILTNTDN